MPKLQQRCKKLLKIAKLQKIEFFICCLGLLNVRTTDNITLMTKDHKAGTSEEVSCGLSLRIQNVTVSAFQLSLNDQVGVQWHAIKQLKGN